MTSNAVHMFPDLGLPPADVMQLIHNRYSRYEQYGNNNNSNGSALAALINGSGGGGGRLTPDEADLAARIQELNETRRRAAQMENTMRWWSKCTVMWREKWKVVRNERNHARAEEALLRCALYTAREELQAQRDGRERAEEEVRALKQRLHEIGIRQLNGGAVNMCKATSAATGRINMESVEVQHLELNVCAAEFTERGVQTTPT